jgi:uncharacterized protein (DUF2236 family)
MNDERLGLNSASWTYIGQWRLMLVLHRALILETAYPAVGAAVHQFSVYGAHPWRRLFHSMGSLQRYVYGTQDQRRHEIQRLERLHKRMRGNDERGRAFTAVDPAARAWVHLSLFEAVVTMHRVGGDPLSRAEQERLYADFLWLAQLFDLEGAHVPATVDAFFEYFDHTVEHVLENNAAVQDLLSGSVYRVPPPPGLRIPHLLWVPVRNAAVAAAVEATVATLPPVLRERFGCAPMPGSQLAVRTLHRSSRIVTGLLPGTWRYMPYAAAAIKAARSAPRHDSALDPILFFTTILDQTGDGRVAWSDLLAMARELATHLDLDEAAEEELYAAFESWWRQLRDATGVASGEGCGNGEGGVEAFTFAQYRAAVDAGRYPGEPNAPEAGDGIAQVVDVVCRIIDRDGNGKISADEYARLFSRSPRQHELIAGLRALDRDGDGTVRTDELAATLRAFLAGQRDLPVVRILLGQA